MNADDEKSAIVGHGSLLLPRSYEPTSVTRQEASSCPGCEWRLVPICLEVDDVCVSAAEWCAPGVFWTQVLRRVAPDPEWKQAGFVCLADDSTPLSVEDAARSVRDRFVDRLPPPRPAFQPAGGGLTNLPVVFRSGQQEGTRVDDFALLGLPVQVAATPSWRWDFGDGATLRTTYAGGRWPDANVSHVYAVPGRHAVTVHASWSGTFTVDGLGPFEVDGGAVSQEATIEVTVREAPAELVNG